MTYARPYFYSFTYTEFDKNNDERILHGYCSPSHCDECTVHKSDRSHAWDGYSEWCVCGHHVTDHKQLKCLTTTKTRPKSWVLQIWDGEIISDCSGGRNKKCFCKFFKPYRSRVSANNLEVQSERGEDLDV